MPKTLPSRFFLLYQPNEISSIKRLTELDSVFPSFLHAN